jgi:hypothetical protein
VERLLGLAVECISPWHSEELRRKTVAPTGEMEDLALASKTLRVLRN